MTSDLRLIEKGFPCHQVGAETRRERSASNMLPPTYYLHVWWARRPLTPSRAAVLGSLLPAGYDPDEFLKALGILRHAVDINGTHWIVPKALHELLKNGVLVVDRAVVKALRDEQETRAENREILAKVLVDDPGAANDPVFLKWKANSQPIPAPIPDLGERLQVITEAADPAYGNARIEFEKAHKLRTADDKYGYDRAYNNAGCLTASQQKVVLDPTSGGGSIPFEALRLGHTVIANELNPVATVILYATCDYPARYGVGLAADIRVNGESIRQAMVSQIKHLFPASPVDGEELAALKAHLKAHPDLVEPYRAETLDGYLHVRTVTCPHCLGEAPLLNTRWLSKEAGDQWAVEVVTDGRQRSGRVQFRAVRLTKPTPAELEAIEAGTVSDGLGQCVHCKQAIDGDEIKAQARGESKHGAWRDVLYAVVATREQPKLNAKGQPDRYKTGENAGQIKTETIRYFRSPNARDLQALAAAETELQKRWDDWERRDMIPTEKFPEGNDIRPVTFGMRRWCDLFTPRQLLGHLIMVEELLRRKPTILKEHGPERGRAIITYLQFGIDKCFDYNSRQTRWITQRGTISGTFGRHDFSLKWTFGEMFFVNEHGGAAWGMEQAAKAFTELAEFVKPLHDRTGGQLPLTIRNGSAANMAFIPDQTVDVVAMDPPYYDNVQYAELSDYFYVWQKRTLFDLYPELYNRQMTDKQAEAVANPIRDGSSKAAKAAYELRMGEIFRESRRVMKDDGVFSIMFTHKSQDAWETLTRAIIDAGLAITATMPVDSEFAYSMHQMNQAAAASSIFLTCRKRPHRTGPPAIWSGFGGVGVQHQVRAAVVEGLKEFAVLQLNPVDEMIASYGRALKVLSEHWPVVDGDAEVSPVRAMTEASGVVAHHQITKITKGRLSVADLHPEAAMALTCFGIWGLGDFAYDEALGLSKALTIRLETKGGGYHADGPFIGIAAAPSGRFKLADRIKADNFDQYHAPLIKGGSKLRLAIAQERDPLRLAKPQTEWDLLHGVLLEHQKGEIVAVRAYLDAHANGKQGLVTDLLQVWATEVGDQAMQREAQTILFGLRGGK